jgi:hypothetical protein
MGGRLSDAKSKSKLVAGVKAAHVTTKTPTLRSG